MVRPRSVTTSPDPQLSAYSPPFPTGFFRVLTGFFSGFFPGFNRVFCGLLKNLEKTWKKPGSIFTDPLHGRPPLAVPEKLPLFGRGPNTVYQKHGLWHPDKSQISVACRGRACPDHGRSVLGELHKGVGALQVDRRPFPSTLSQPSSEGPNFGKQHSLVFGVPLGCCACRSAL